MGSGYDVLEHELELCGTDVSKGKIDIAKLLVNQAVSQFQTASTRPRSEMKYSL